MSTFDLFSSVRDGNTEIVRRLLQSKTCRARLNDRNEWGDTALHLAAEVGNGEICQMLTAAGASVTVRNNRGETCLHRAAVGGHVEAVRAIVGRDQDPDAVNSQNDAGYTALHHAAKHGSKELIDILVKAGADQMIENNAGETPYMVAHKYQQWDAERLLLNVEQQHADKAIREMNRKEKDIIRGYLNAIKYASQLESRVRVMLVGDTGSGKTSLKKTLSGESYEPGEKPSYGINADPSVTRVTFKQFKEWVQQPSSKADTHRLNLEYIDVVIDYILKFVRQPQIVSDDHLDPNALQIEKEKVKTVHFDPEDDIIPIPRENLLESAGSDVSNNVSEEGDAQEGSNPATHASKEGDAQEGSNPATHASKEGDAQEGSNPATHASKEGDAQEGSNPATHASKEGDAQEGSNPATHASKEGDAQEGSNPATHASKEGDAQEGSNPATRASKEGDAQEGSNPATHASKEGDAQEGSNPATHASKEGDAQEGSNPATRANPSLENGACSPKIEVDIEVHYPPETKGASGVGDPQVTEEEGGRGDDLPGGGGRRECDVSEQHLSSSEDEGFVKVHHKDDLISKRPSVTFADALRANNGEGSTTPTTNRDLALPIATDTDTTDLITTEECDSSISYLDKEEGEYFMLALSDEDDNYNEDDRLHRLAMESKSMSYTDPNSMGVSALDHHPTPRSGSLSSLEGALPNEFHSTRQSRNQSTGMTGASSDKDQSVQVSQSSNDDSEFHSSDKQLECTAMIFNQTQRELSRLLIEKLPMEILKRMVIRWPVGNEHYQDRSSLNSNRLAMTIWDVSGDPIQANFIPLFFSNRCLFVVSYNLTKELNQPCLSHRKKNLTNVNGSIPTNAEVLESWLGTATAFTKKTPSEPFKCTEKTPLLPPIVIACTHSDHPSLKDYPVLFHQFFNRKSFKSYSKHLVEANNPSALRLSNRYETLSTKSEVELEVPYSGHHLLRREIEYLARQLPYVQDNIPVQWIKFEQLVCGLQQQKKLILIYDDLAHYISEHCNLSGPLQVIPVLSHFHDIGAIVHFYRHPDLSGIVITRPQWLTSALSSIITSSPVRSITPEVQDGYKRLSQVGSIPKEILLIIYRCARMGQKYWNEMLFILNCMDLITCHPSLHESRSVYLPAMVIQTSPNSPHVIPSEGDPCPIHFRTLEGANFPIALFNQFVVRCIRSSQYKPTLYYKQAHFRLNETHHLVIWMEHGSIACLVQENTHCTDCISGDDASQTRYSFEPKCSSIGHLIGEDCELMPTDNISVLIQSSTNSGVNVDLHLSFSDDFSNLEKLCPVVLKFVEDNLHFLCSCWFPGLDLVKTTNISGTEIVLNQFWKHTMLYKGKAEDKLAIWFSQ